MTDQKLAHASVRHRTANAIRPYLGPERTQSVGEAFDEVARFWEYIRSPVGRESVHRLMDMKDRYRGQRAFVIGNGPSLRKMDLAPLRNEITFGSNRIYLMFEELGFKTTFLTGCAEPIISQFGSEMAQAGVQQVFLSHRYARKAEIHGEYTAFLSRGRRRFGTHPLFWGFHDGGTVTNTSIQLAHHFGFSEVILIGVDHSFKETGAVAADVLPKLATDRRPDTVVSRGDDPNHFVKNYFGPGVRWELPDWVQMESGYERARKHFERTGRRIVDATVDGKLQVFPKVAYEAVIGSRRS